jgi:DNA-binding HxlR family transcriptional regulator
MRSYRQFCPIAKASEILAERWTPLIVRELLMGSTRFSELEWGVPGIPRSLLSQRLRFLVQAGIVERRGHGRNGSYHLTEAGQELFDIIERLGVWGQKWVNTEVRDEDVVDASLLMWDMRRRVNWENVPQRRVTIHFRVPDSRRQNFWIVLDRNEASVCLQDPGFGVDLEVTAEAMTLHRLWMGHEIHADAVRQGRLSIEGQRQLVRGFPAWFSGSVFSGVAPADRPLQPVA